MSKLTLSKFIVDTGHEDLSFGFRYRFILICLNNCDLDFEKKIHEICTLALLYGNPYQGNDPYIKKIIPQREKATAKIFKHAIWLKQ